MHLDVIVVFKNCTIIYVGRQQFLATSILTVYNYYFWEPVSPCTISSNQYNFQQLCIIIYNIWQLLAISTTSYWQPVQLYNSFYNNVLATSTTLKSPFSIFIIGNAWILSILYLLRHSWPMYMKMAKGRITEVPIILYYYRLEKRLFSSHVSIHRIRHY